MLRERDHVAHVEVVGHDLRAIEQPEAQVEQRVRVGVDAVEDHALVADVADAGVEHRPGRLGHQRGDRVGVVDVGVDRDRDPALPWRSSPTRVIPSTTSGCSQCCGSPISALVASRMSRMFSISSRSVRKASSRGQGMLATSPPETTTSRTDGRAAQVVEHVAEPVVRLADELQLVDDRGGVADQVHAGAVAAVLRAGRQQLGEHLGGVAVGEPLGRPHVVLVQRVAGGVRVRGPVGAAVGEDREHVVADRVGVERLGQRAGAGRARRGGPSCSSSAAAPASTWWPARPGRARGRRRTARRPGRRAGRAAA